LACERAYAHRNSFIIVDVTSIIAGACAKSLRDFTQIAVALPALR
jgi:hypothetical protein